MQKRMLMTLLVVLAGGCGVSKDEFAAAQRDAEQNLKNYQDEAQKTAALEKKVAELQKQNKELTTTSATLAQEKDVLQAKSAQYEQLTGALQKQIASGQVEISELRGKMTVKLRDRVLFASGSSALNKEGKAALDAVADAFKELKDKNVIVAGYTDDVPTGSKSGFKDNWDLSTARSVTVVRYLQSKGVEPMMLGAAGFSQYRPLAPNDSAQNRSQNRRIEIALTAADYTAPTVDMAKEPRSEAPAARGDEPIEMQRTKPGQAIGERTRTVKANVKAVDATKRTITVQGEDGIPETFRVGPEVNRLNEIAPGDTIVVTFKQGLMLQTKTPKGAEPGGAIAAEQGSEDAPPSAVATAAVQGTVTIAAVDRQSRIVVLQTETGDMFKVKAGPKIQLNRVKIGDKLFGIYIETLAISVEKANAGPSKTN